MTDDVTRLCNLVVAEFAAWEQHIDPADVSGGRDETLVRFTLRVLADPGYPLTAAAVEHIDRQRATTQAAWIGEAA